MATKARLHEVLAAEGTVTTAAAKLFAEMRAKFGKMSEFFTGHKRTLRMVVDDPGNTAVELAAASAVHKELPTTVYETAAYTFAFIEKGLDVRLRKHLTNQHARADVMLGTECVMADVPVDFLLDLEKELPQWREAFLAMPTLDPSKKWEAEREYVYKTMAQSTKTEKKASAVELSPATKEHKAQIKEVSNDVVVGLFTDVTFSGVATAQQKADVLALLDQLIVAVKEARMRANTTEVVEPGTLSRAITSRVLATLEK